GIQPLRESYGVLHGRLRDQLHVISNPEVQREMACHSPVILSKHRVLPQVRVCCGARGARARIGFKERVSRGGNGKAEKAFSKIIETGKGIGAREISREEIEYAVAENVAAKFESVAAVDPRQGVTVLLAMDGGFSRTERVPADKQKR